MILVDTNVLARLTNSRSPQCAPARDAVFRLLSEARNPVLVPQVLYEFWVIATRRAGTPPAGSNGLGMTVSQAGQWLSFFMRRFPVLPDPPNITGLWRDLIMTAGITGFRAHDARLVAAMQSYQIDQLLTFNGADFRGLPVRVIDPTTL